MAREPREQFVVDVLTDGWNSSNTFGLTPSIIYASRDEPSSPHISIEMPDGGAIQGGSTGFSHINPSSGSPHQTFSETVNCHCFADSDDLSGASTNSPEEYLTGSGSSGGSVSGGVADEIRRIVDNNKVTPTNPTTGNQPVQLMAVTGLGPGPTDEPTQAHFIVTLTLIHRTS